MSVTEKKVYRKPILKQIPSEEKIKYLIFVSQKTLMRAAVECFGSGERIEVILGRWVELGASMVFQKELEATR